MVKENAGRALSMIAGSGADLVVLPELFSTGYNFRSVDEVREMAEPSGDSVAVGILSETAHSENMHIIAGFAELGGDGKLYNSAALIRPGGKIEVYRKCHLFYEEKKWFSPGKESPPVFEVGDSMVGLMICFDWIFPEVSRILALKGADIICHPANLVLPFCQKAMVTRSMENAVFTITANRIGTESRGETSLTFTGNSQITNPKGKILKRSSEETEELVLADVEPSTARDKKITPMNDIFEDRRDDIYNLSYS